MSNTALQWQAVVGSGGRVSIVDREEFHKIATVHKHDEQAEFAQLIAAAPDLLEALIMVRDADEDCRKDGLRRINTMARAKIDRAIAAAKGK